MTDNRVTAECYWRLQQSKFFVLVCWLDLDIWTRWTQQKSFCLCLCIIYFSHYYVHSCVYGE